MSEYRIRQTNTKGSQGFTLIELLVGMLIGSVLVAGVIQTLALSRVSVQKHQDMVAISDTSRYILESIKRQARMTDLIGDVPQISYDAASGALRMTVSSSQISYFVMAGNEILYRQIDSATPEPMIPNVKQFDVLFQVASDAGAGLQYTYLPAVSLANGSSAYSFSDINAIRLALKLEGQPTELLQTIALRNTTLTDNTTGLSGSTTPNPGTSTTPVNTPPFAKNDLVSIDEDSGPHTLNSLLLSNDTDIDGDTLTITNIQSPLAEEGTLVGTWEFEPTENFNGIVTLDYDISDGNGGVASAQVQITVVAINDNPVAQNDAGYEVEAGETLTLNVLDNDTDVDNDTLIITNYSNVPSEIDVTNIDNQSLRVSSNTAGDYNFDYTISDGNGGTSSATVYVSVTTPKGLTLFCSGDVRSDINGTASNDYICVGEDLTNRSKIETYDGDDTIDIGDDMDDHTEVDSGSGNDIVRVDDDIKEDARIDTGSGDDLVEIGGKIEDDSQILLGDGDDRLVLHDRDIDHRSDILGGAGFDTVIISDNMDRDFDQSPFDDIKGFEALDLTTADVDIDDVEKSDVQSILGQDDGDLFILRDGDDSVNFKKNSDWNRNPSVTSPLFPGLSFDRYDDDTPNNDQLSVWIQRND